MKRSHSQHAHQRTGTALVVVLVVIVMLSLGAYIYSQTMITEYKATDSYSRSVQAEQWANSGIEYVAALLTPDGGGFEEDLFDNPALFHQQMTNGGGFTIVTAISDPGYGLTDKLATSSGLRFGLVDECSRINLNVIANFEILDEDPIARNMLLNLPYMTEPIADSILDWIDADDDPREYGAEFESYSVTLPRNGAIDTIEELLLVQGVTPQLLYGEDANRNGLLDPNENDGIVSLPFDNEDGVLDLGWSEYLTTNSVESNYRHAIDKFGEERINVNEPLLTELYDLIAAEFDEEVAQFVVAYRMTEAADDTGLRELAGAIAGLLVGKGDGSVTRGGMDLSTGAGREITSLYELIEVQVEATIDGKQTTLVSPWTSDAGDLQQTLPMLFDTFTVTDATAIQGRININQATTEVLLGIPEMPLDLPDAIISTRASRVPSSDPLDIYRTTGWLLMQGLTDLETMITLDGYITTRGEVYRMQVIGHADRGGPMTRIEAVVDASQDIPKIIYQRNMSELGPGYRANQLPTFNLPNTTK